MTMSSEKGKRNPSHAHIYKPIKPSLCRCWFNVAAAVAVISSHTLLFRFVRAISFCSSFTFPFDSPRPCFFLNITIYSNMIHAHNKNTNQSIHPSRPMTAFIAVPRYIIHIHIYYI